MSYGMPALSAQKTACIAFLRVLVVEPTGRSGNVEELEALWSWPVSVPVDTTGSHRSTIKWNKVFGMLFAVGFSAGAWTALVVSVMHISRYLR
jgi:hypothetical protein